MNNIGNYYIEKSIRNRSIRSQLDTLDTYGLDLMFEAGFPLKYSVSPRQMSGWLSVAWWGDGGDRG